MKPYNEWTKNEVLAHYIKKYPPIEKYTNRVTWEQTDSSWLPAFPDAPVEVSRGLDEALRQQSE